MRDTRLDEASLFSFRRAGLVGASEPALSKWSMVKENGFTLSRLSLECFVLSSSFLPPPTARESPPLSHSTRHPSRLSHRAPWKKERESFLLLTGEIAPLCITCQYFVANAVVSQFYHGPQGLCFSKCTFSKWRLFVPLGGFSRLHHAWLISNNMRSQFAVSMLVTHMLHERQWAREQARRQPQKWARGQRAGRASFASCGSGKQIRSVKQLPMREGGRQKTNNTGPSFYGLQLSSATKQ